VVAVFTCLYCPLEVRWQKAGFSRGRQSIDLCAEEQGNPKSSPRNSSEIWIQHLPERLVAGFPLDDRRSGDPFEDVARTG
jgi:hypothetical protein